METTLNTIIILESTEKSITPDVFISIKQEDKNNPTPVGSKKNKLQLFKNTYFNKN